MANKSSSTSSSTTTSFPAIKPEDYKHSPIHYAVALGDHSTLTRLVSTLPKLSDPAQIHTELDSLSQEQLADQISSLLDSREVPFRETPLHLSVRLNDLFAAKTLANAGADVSLQNSAGWNPLQEALCRRSSDIALLLLKIHHKSAWSKWRRRLPRVIAVLRRMRDFYMEISFHFESSVIPFVGKIAPSDTYKIWKRDAPMTESDINGFCSQTSVYRPGIDVTKAELASRTNWRGVEKTENVGEWKARVYEINNVLFSFRSRKVVNNSNTNNVLAESDFSLQLDEDDDGFFVAEIDTKNHRHSSFQPQESLNFNNKQTTSSNNFQQHRHSSFQQSHVSHKPPRHSSFQESRDEWVSVGRKSVDVYPSLTAPPRKAVMIPRKMSNTTVVQTKEKEYVRNVRPSVWLTEQFPLKTDELLPLLDILANKVKAVRRLRELLTTKFPPGTFPVKVAIPVVPTVKVVITFTKFVELEPIEQFYTPLSSPRLLSRNSSGDEKNSDDTHVSFFSWSSSSTGSSWLRRNNSQSSSSGSKQQQQSSTSSLGSEVHQTDPFAIPGEYTWTSVDDSKNKSNKMKRSKSTRKSTSK
ncbi:hypothetical protein ACFE04_007883 [Oxalis oulophora]